FLRFHRHGAARCLGAAEGQRTVGLKRTGEDEGRIYSTYYTSPTYKYPNCSTHDENTTTIYLELGAGHLDGGRPQRLRQQEKRE
ncbi:MAG: hypothetical protein IJ892_12055, partial [Prevotella sp.]|nr:hypothetical protein [Prevotella sp.]